MRTSMLAASTPLPESEYARMIAGVVSLVQPPSVGATTWSVGAVRSTVKSDSPCPGIASVFEIEAVSVQAPSASGDSGLHAA